MKKTIATGTMTLNVTRNDTGLEEDQLFAIAARRNPKRGYLIVSNVIGRHTPTRPGMMRNIMAQMATMLDADAPGPILILGMAETAVGLAQGVHEAFQRMTGRDDVWFLQSTRQTHSDMPIWTTFEEGHSHATSHLVHRPVNDAAIGKCRTLVIVDDESSTGKTFIEAERAMREVLTCLQRVVDIVITDWSGGTERDRRSLVAGNIIWEPSGTGDEIPGANAGSHGETVPEAAAGRTGYRDYVHRVDVPDRIGRETRVTVLCDGENAYDALLVAEALERDGVITALQSITRSPAHVCDVLETRAILSDAHGSGATCYSYNLLSHRPDSIVIVVERPRAQREEVIRETGLPSDAVHQVTMRDLKYQVTGEGKSRGASEREKPC